PLVVILHRTAVGVAQVQRIKRRRTQPAKPRAEGMRHPRPRQQRRNVINRSVRRCRPLQHSTDSTTTAEEFESTDRPLPIKRATAAAPDAARFKIRLYPL